MREQTEQEAFWQGEFGDAYTERNQYDPLKRAPQWRMLLERAPGVSSICEFGANRGLNLVALNSIDPNLQLNGVEINPTAFAELVKRPFVKATQGAIQDITAVGEFDLTFTSGVLIHVNPESLPLVYRRLYEASRQYVLMIEYFNPVPIEIEYRGHSGRLFKRDFAGEFIDTVGSENIEIVDYGFWWRRVLPQWDNATWVLMRKKK